MLLKCKICGGDLEVQSGSTIGTCLYCGSTITLPRIDSDKKLRLFNRANQYRINCEFDKAYDVYNAIISEDETEAEAYWGMVLSEYGVEYVEDPLTKKRIPTCHRTQIASLTSTTNYNLAIKYADSECCFAYQDEAEEIDRIQKSILAISQKEEPYDVFICYKETDDITGERTRDSLIAQEIYVELEKQGLKVFFSRITLAEKLGEDFEPYIYSALNTAKVMLVVCTSSYNVNSIWVKNEWSRYLRFMQANSNRAIIPVYEGIEAYSLPDDLQKFQAQDYKRIGALQDLVLGIKKLVSIEEREIKNNAIDDLIQEKIKREQTKKIAIVVAIVVVSVYVIVQLILGSIKLYKEVIHPNSVYKEIQKLINAQEYDDAVAQIMYLYEYHDGGEYTVFNNIISTSDEDFEKAYKVAENVDGFKDTKAYLIECLTNIAVENWKKGDLDLAESQLLMLSKYDIAKEHYLALLVEKQCLMDTYYTAIDSVFDELSEQQVYEIAKHLYNLEDYQTASSLFQHCLNYEDSLDYCKNAIFEMAIQDNRNEGQQLRTLYYLGNGTTILEMDPLLGDKAKFKKAEDMFEEKVSEMYENAIQLYNKNDWVKAKTKFQILFYYKYKDSESYLIQCNTKISKKAK